MGVKDFTPDEENQLYRELADLETRRNAYSRQASEQMAGIVDRLVRGAPYASPEVAWSTAQAVRDGMMSEEQALSALDGAYRVELETDMAEPEDTRSWFKKATDQLHEGLKSGVKWGTAGLELVPQLVTNAMARGYSALGGAGEDELAKYYSKPQTGFFDGFFASTDFGSLLSGAESGSGYFIGEEAFKQQQEKVKEYRGTIDDKGWTLGRGFGLIFSQPGSRTYNIASGLVDAAYQLAIPSVPAPIAKAGVKAADLAGFRRVSGLGNFSDPYVNLTKVDRWLESNSGATVVNKIVDTTSISEAKKMFPNADSDFWVDIVDAGTDVTKTRVENVSAVKDMLRENLGLTKGLTRLDQMRVGKWDELRQGASFKSTRFERLFSIVPGRELVVVGGNARDATRTINNAEGYLKTLRVEQGVRDELLKDLSVALKTGDRAAVRGSYGKLRDTIIDEVDKQARVGGRSDKEFLERLFGDYEKQVDEFYLYGLVDETGTPKDISNLNVDLADGTAATNATLTGAVAQLATEAQKFQLYLPDPRNLRRATSTYGRLFTRAAKDPDVFGDPKGWVSALDFIQNKTWRPLTLMTGGYMFRNMLESVLRQSTTTGIKAGPRHPLEWVQAMMHRKYVGDWEGDVWATSARQAAIRADREYVEATGAKMREAMDASFLEQKAYKSGYYSLTKNVPNNPDYITGVATEVRLLAGDEVARLLAGGEVPDTVLRMMLDGDMARPEFRKYLRDLQSRWKNRELVVDGNKVRGNVRIMDADGKVDIDNLKAYIDSVDYRVKLKTGGDQTLRDIIANAETYGSFTTRKGAQAQAFRRSEVNLGTPVDEFEPFDYTPEFLEEIGLIIREGQVQLPEFVKFTKPLKSQMVGGKSRASMWDKTLNHFFGNVFGKKEAFVNRSPVFRQFYYKKIDDIERAGLLSREAYEEAYKNIVDAARRVPDETLRQVKALKPQKNGMYVWNAEEISAAKYQKLVRKAEADVARADRVVRKNADGTMELLDDAWGAKYVGSGDLWDRIKKGRAAGADDGLTASEASIAAKAFAAEETKATFYNAAETNNFADIMRIAVPFGPAWGEAMKYYYKEFLRKPNRAKNLSVSVQGFRDMDPDADGKGFIYTDPVTGEQVFNYPFAPDLAPIIGGLAGGVMLQTLSRGGMAQFGIGAVAGAVTGEVLGRTAEEKLGDVAYGMTAPAQSLSQSFQVLPGFGPVVQMAASQLLGNKPQYDDVLSIVAPFGAYESPTSSLIPSWAKKITAAINADPDNDRLFGDLYIDAYRALYATGEFDNTNPEEMQTLRERAMSAAQTLLVLRGLGQFVGPTRPEPELYIPTKYEGEVSVGDVEMFVKNNIPSSILAAAFKKMQEDDYEGAVQNFLRTFGPDSMLYIPGLSQTKVKGLGATDLIGDWERNNYDITEKFPLVYGYFAPVGGEFELQTYLRQIRSKKRTKITDPQELQQDAEAVVGKALYMDAVRVAGKNLSQTDRDELRNYKMELERQLPGFATVPLNINEQQQVMMQVIDAVGDADLDGNPVAEAARIYFQYRDQVVQEAVLRNDGVDTGELLSRNANGDLRQYMRTVGETLMRRYPEFERMYARVLFDEVDL